MWTDNNITDKYRDFEIDVNKLFDHGILTEEYDKLRIINKGETFLLLLGHRKAFKEGDQR